MTEPITSGVPPADRPAAQATPRARPRIWPTVLASVACFLVIFEFLALRLASGNDPALGGSQVSAAPPARTTVVDRKLIRTRVVHDPASPARSAGSVSGAATSAVPAPAPAPATPAPVPTPAPVTPVTTSAS